MSDFEWSDVEEDIVVESVAAIAVYFDPKGAVVIRQQGDEAISEDKAVVFPAIQMGKLIAMQSNLDD
jgi:hypothetical protein